MNLVIDIGNTATKTAIFSPSKITEKATDKIENLADRIQFFNKKYTINNCIISSVITDTTSFLTACQKLFPTIILSSKTAIPIINKYSTPITLGNDRLACATACAAQFNKQNTLSIDFGTCIKYDFVDNLNQYKGGAISPGMQMRFKSLHTFTSQLPLVKPTELKNHIGRNTETSILSGVQNGIIAEVNGVISQYIHQFGQLNTIITGGDHKYFDKALKNITFADPYLVLKGLNEILKFNTQ